MTVLPMAPRQRGVCCTPERRMPTERVEQLSEVLKALADPTRLEIVAILRDATEPVCVCDLTSTFDLSQPTLSHHMARLRQAGLIESEKRGIWAFYRLRADLAPQVKRFVEAIR